ncbi:MAG: regulatory subunit of cAMP-dependent protein kinase [Chloroflexi bacterium]|nr:regulatory subunit of cAMP-dependent protein kinase [Chloroflexota bacterium]
MLASLTIFKGIPADRLRQLAERGRPRTFRRDEPLMRQGELGHTMHVILAGQVAVERSHPAIVHPIQLSNLGVGEVVGEMGLLDGEPRSATVTAVEQTETLEVERHDLEEVIIQYPAVSVALLRVLSRRLRDTDELVERVRLQAPGAEGAVDP